MLQKIFQLNHPLGQKIRFFCINSKPNTALSPERHIYMTHNFQNMYDEPVPMGSFPIVAVKAKIESQEYAMKIQQIVIDHLTEVYPRISLKLDPTQQHENLFTSWKALNVADFENEKETILHKLASGIIVKQSKLNWIKEQRERLNYTQTHFQGEFPYPQVFYNYYNQLLWAQVRQSNQWSDPNIRGAPGLLFAQLVDDITPRIPIESLSAPNEENGTAINRFMRFVHS